MEIRWWEAEERPDEQEVIKKIEQRKQGDVILLLQSKGLGRNRRRKQRDYSEAKKIVFEGMFINSEIYDRQIGWICDFLRV